MKNLLLPVMFISLLSFTNGNGFASEGNASGNVLHLSHDQYMVTYIGAVVNDVVGVFDPWYPTQDTTSGKFSFSLIYSKNGTYAIDNSTGIVTINNNTNLSNGSDALIVRTTLQGQTQDNYLYVRVKATSDCYFIDPSAGSNGSGTRNSPFNSWSSVTFKAGKAYFQKRGTKYSKPIQIFTGGTDGNEIILGAYGTGSRPMFSCGLEEMGMQVTGSYVWFFEFEFNTNQYGIQMESSGVSAIGTHCLFSDITLENSAPINGMIYFKHMDLVTDHNRSYHRVYDIKTSSTVYGQGYYGMKIETCNNLIENFRGYDLDYQTISIPEPSWYNTISGVSSFNTNNGMEVSGVGNDISYCYFKNNYRGIVVDDPGSVGSIIHHCLFDGGTGDASIKLRANGGYWQPPYEMMSFGRDIRIEDNEIKNNIYSAGISVEFAMKNTIISRNKIHNNYYGIRTGIENEGVDTVKIFYNVLYNNTINDIQGLAGNHILIYNNVIDGSVDCSGTSNNLLINNFYKTLKGTFSSTTNIDMNQIKSTEYFNNYSGHNYTLKSTAVNAIKRGTNLGLESDFNVQPVKNTPDIGAFEYVTAAEYINQAPVINNQTFDISSENAGTFNGRIIASDPDAGQVLKYTIASGNEAGIFSLNATTGLLTCDASKINFNNSLTYNLMVQVNDNGSPILSASATIKIIIYQYVNQPPVIKDQAFYISSENAGTFSGKIIASDPDAGQSVSYSVVSGNEAGIFNLNATTGALTCYADKLSFEKSLVYNLKVQVNDNGNPILSGSSTVAVNIGESINHEPLMNNQTFVISSDNVSTFSKKISASDPDAGQVLKYSITSGNDAGIFSLNATAGILTCTAGKISFEKPVIYNLTVMATDNGNPNLSASSAVKITSESNLTTFYIDPTNQQDDIHNGTEEHPFSSWKQVSWVSGNTYLQKCGTVSQETKVNISASNVKIGSYGEGDQPVIQSNVNDFAVRAFEKSNVVIENLHIIAPEAVSCIYIIGEGTDSITIRNCIFEGAVNGVRVLNALNITICYNTFINNSEAIYCYADKSLIYYNVFRENDIAIDALGYTATSEIYNNIFYNNDVGISNSYSELTLYNNIFYLGKESNTAINNQMDKLVSDNNIFYPEREGFIKMDNRNYNSLHEFQQDKSLDMNSFTEDPQFVDVYNMNFALKMTSPAINAGKTVGLQMDFNGTAVPYGGFPDIGLIEWDYSAGSPTALPDISDSPEQGTFQVYPNPSNGVFNVYVKNENSTASSIIVKDLLGKTVFMNKYGSSIELLQQIDISNLKQGIYIVVVENTAQSLSQTIIIN